MSFVLVEASALMPTWYWVLVVGMFGVVIGSFVNVMLYRFHTNSSINTPSHCLSCQQRLRWFELIPVVSYITLRGLCRTCKAHIPARDFIVETLFGCIFVGVFLLQGSSLTFLFIIEIILASILLAIVLYDLTHFIIPDSFLLAVVLLWVVQIFYTMPGTDILLQSLVAATVSFLALYLLWFVSKGQWIGFGDVKLVTVLALFLTPTLAFSMMVLSFWIGAAISICIVCTHYFSWRYTTRLLDKKYKSFTMKSEVPFAPYIILSFTTVYIWQLNVLTIFNDVFVL